MPTAPVQYRLGGTPGGVSSKHRCVGSVGTAEHAIASFGTVSHRGLGFRVTLVGGVLANGSPPWCLCLTRRARGLEVVVVTVVAAIPVAIAAPMAAAETLTSRRLRGARNVGVVNAVLVELQQQGELGCTQLLDLGTTVALADDVEREVSPVCICVSTVLRR